MIPVVFAICNGIAGNGAAKPLEAADVSARIRQGRKAGRLPPIFTHRLIHKGDPGGETPLKPFIVLVLGEKLPTLGALARICTLLTMIWPRFDVALP